MENIQYNIGTLAESERLVVQQQTPVLQPVYATVEPRLYNDSVAEIGGPQEFLSEEALALYNNSR
jgi:hypothetical protein